MKVIHEQVSSSAEQRRMLAERMYGYAEIRGTNNIVYVYYSTHHRKHAPQVVFDPMHDGRQLWDVLEKLGIGVTPDEVGDFWIAKVWDSDIEIHCSRTAREAVFAAALELVEAAGN